MLLIVRVVIQVYTFVKTHQNVYQKIGKLCCYILIVLHCIILYHVIYCIILHYTSSKLIHLDTNKIVSL